VIVNAPGERLWAKPPMHQPLLAKHGMQGVDGSAADKIQRGLGAEGNASVLRG
jgi:hypothetical protein